MQYINFTNLIGPSVFLVLFNRDPIDVVVRVVVIIVRLAEVNLFLLESEFRVTLVWRFAGESEV